MALSSSCARRPGAAAPAHCSAFYACVAAAVLAKGPAGLAVLAAGLVATVATRGPSGLAHLKPLHGAVVLAAAGAVWFAPFLVQSEGRLVPRVFVGHYTTWYLAGGSGPASARSASCSAISCRGQCCWPPPWCGGGQRPDPGRRWLGPTTITLTIVLGLTATSAPAICCRCSRPALLVAEFVGRAGADGGRRALGVGTWLFAGVVAAAAGLVPFLPRIWWATTAPTPRRLLERTVIATLVIWRPRESGHRGPAPGLRRRERGDDAVHRRGDDPRGHRHPARSRARQRSAAAGGGGWPARTTRNGGHRASDARLSLDFYVRRPRVEAATPEVAAALVARTGGAVVTARSHCRRWPRCSAGPARVAATAEVGGRDYVVIVP